MSAIRAAVVALLLLAWTLLLLPVQWLALRWPTAAGRMLREAVPVLYHRGAAFLMGLKIRVVGDPSSTRPTLFVSNHVSWLDIVVYGALLKAAFIARSEVATWPGFGGLARLSRTVFIDRLRRRTADQRDIMAARLDDGDSLILFAEGTSSDGMRILPFKSAFLVLAEGTPLGRPLPVQPVAIAYFRLNGLPVGRRLMPIFAWVGGENLWPHLWNYLSRGTAEVAVIFHPPVTVDRFPSRKEMAAYCRDVIARSVSEVHAGRRADLTGDAGPPAHAPPLAAGGKTVHS
jgi:1-acyl-sn-glycerol-3-phosphate acyltransferase